MLVDVNFEQKLFDECIQRLKESLSPEEFENFPYKKLGDSFTRVRQGIYYSNSGGNFHIDIQVFSNDVIKKRYDSFSGFKLDEKTGGWDMEYYNNYIESGNNPRNNYGICDNYEQILKYYPELLEDNNRKFVVALCLMLDKGEKCNYDDGWVCKNGEYIGVTKELGEEDVYLYHIYEME
jgi:hypothetical protein